MIDSKGNIQKIPLSINALVISLSFFPNGKRIAAMNDMSLEDNTGRLHILGKSGYYAMVSPGDFYIVSFHNEKGMISYKEEYLKRSRLCLRLIDTEDLELNQKK